MHCTHELLFVMMEVCCSLGRLPCCSAGLPFGVVVKLIVTENVDNLCSQLGSDARGKWLRLRAVQAVRTSPIPFLLADAHSGALVIPTYLFDAQDRLS